MPGNRDITYPTIAPSVGARVETCLRMRKRYSRAFAPYEVRGLKRI